MPNKPKQVRGMRAQALFIDGEIAKIQSLIDYPSATNPYGIYAETVIFNPSIIKQFKVKIVPVLITPTPKKRK